MSKIHPTEEDEDKDKDGKDDDKDNDTSVNFEQWLLGKDYGTKRDHRKGRCGWRPRMTLCKKRRGAVSQSCIGFGNGRNPEKFIQLDMLVIIIMLVYIICIVITGIAVWCYKEDSRWNSIVHSKRAFPIIGNENFFGGKHLFIYDDEELVKAKKNLLRENRWLEPMHLLFMGTFLVCTLFQLSAYLTRGHKDHSKVIVCYYTIFGGLGLLVALFPLLSWHNQQNSYMVAGHHLHNFARGVWKNGRKPWPPGKTNATAQDAWTLGGIIKFCYEVSQDGVNFETDMRAFSNYKRWYRLRQFQQLGFCTHYELKIINTILSTLFALLCCAIPCFYCFVTTKQQRFKMERLLQIGRGRSRSFILVATSRDAEMDGEKENKPGSKMPLESLSAQERKEIEKWKSVVEAANDEH